MLIEERLADLVAAAIEASAASGKLKIETAPSPVVEKPREKSHGDWATNAALVLAKEAGLPPRQIAELIIEALPETDYLKAVEIAGPGFINFRLSNAWLYRTLNEICEKQDDFGRSASAEDAEYIQIEFVSANPVGPMHVGHGRWAALGDSLARLLEAAGNRVEREFYINDYGNQMRVFGASVAARYRQLFGRELNLPEDGYQGHYIIDIAREIVADDQDRYLDLTEEEQAQIFSERAYRQVLEHLEKTLTGMNVHFDSWFSEKSLHESGAVERTVGELEKKGLAYRADGAVWLRTTDYGDDKDRVLIRENGQPTYFAADVAYHRDKFGRDFDRLINIWGADHHGYVARVKAAAAALKYDPDRLEIIIGQLVNLFSGGRPVRMSKRTGEMVTLDELLTEVGPDAARYFFLMRSTDTALDFDIELAKSNTADNPVYYVQYAHARICSILRHAADQGLTPAGAAADFTLLTEEAELELLRHLAEAPSVIVRAAKARAPYRLARYLEGLAAAFHQFYHQCRVVGEDSDLSRARLTLADAARQVIGNVLSLMGVSAPEKM